MTETRSFPAQYFDGRTARSRDVIADVSAEGVRIREEDSLVLAVWRADAVRLAGGHRKGGAVRLRNGDSDAARLTIADAMAYALLKQLCPHLHRSAGRFRDNWKPIVAWSAGAIASIAFLLLVGVPFLAGLLASAIPPEAEAAWGEEIVDEAVAILSQRMGGGAEPRLCDGAAGKAALDRLAARLTAARDLPLMPEIHVLDAPTVNAFALPGGQIVLLSGLIDAAHDPAEVAGVLAHEIGHAVLRHPLEIVIEQAGLATLLGFLIGDVSGSTIIVAGTQFLLLASYTRAAEREADAVAVELLNEADISAEPMAAFFDRLAAESEPDGSALSMLRTHPLSDERADAIRTMATGKAAAMSESDWRALRAICDDD